MKKVVLVISLLLCFLVTGCDVSDSERRVLFNELKKQNIIDKNTKEIGVFKDASGSIDGATLYDEFYLYSVGDKYLTIYYNQDIFPKDSGCTYRISIVFNPVKKEIPEVDSEGNHRLSSEIVYRYGENSSSKRYCVVVSKTLNIFKSYTFKDI